MKDIILLTIAGISITILLIILLGGFIYFKTGFGKKFFHDILGWHVPDETKKYTFDGCSVHNICKYCGKDIMQDSQGNWF